LKTAGGIEDPHRSPDLRWFRGLWTAKIINDPVPHYDFSRYTTIASVSGHQKSCSGPPNAPETQPDPANGR
jgi:hypothetical protein